MQGQLVQLVTLVGGSWSACDIQSVGSVHILCMKTTPGIKDPSTPYMMAKPILPATAKQ